MISTTKFPTESPISGEALSTLRLVYSQGDSCAGAVLTIVICSYNHGRYIRDCLESIDAVADAHKIALIVIDDGSPDDSLNMIRSFPFKPELSVRVYSKANAGLRDSLLKGLSLASTPFVAFIASDDHYIPPALDHVLTSLSEAPSDDICWVYQAIYLDGRDGEMVYGDHMTRIMAMEPSERLKALSVEYPKPLLVQSSIFGTETLRRTGSWTDDLELDDWPTFLRIARASLAGEIDFRFVPEPALCRYRLHAGGVHNDLDRQLCICLDVVYKLVAPAYRQEAISRAYSDIGLVYLNGGQFIQAGRLFLRAIAAQPTWAAAMRPARRIGAAAYKRLRKHFHSQAGRYQ